MPKEFSRASRINQQLQEVLSVLIRELRDPRIGDITVTAVDAAADMRSANIKVSSFGDDAALAQSVKVLNHASGKLRRDLGRQLTLRYIPELRFLADRALREGDRIAAIIRDARAADDRVAAARQQAEPDGSVNGSSNDG